MGKSQFWLNIGCVCLTLTFLSHCFCSLEEYCLYIKACLRELWPSVRILNWSAFIQNPIHLWMAGRKKLAHPLPKVCYFILLLLSLLLFLLYFLTSPHFCSVKEPGIQTQARWLFWDICLPSSRSAGFLDKVIFLASTAHSSDLLACHAASRASLDLVTKWSTTLKYLPLTHVYSGSFVRRQMQSTHMFSYTRKWDGFLNAGHWTEFLSYKGHSRDFFKKKKQLTTGSTFQTHRMSCKTLLLATNSICHFRKE